MSRIFLSNFLESLGYFVRTPSTAVDDATDSLIKAARSSGSLR